ncbi:FAS1-like dehydratase domain-containing protein [Sciscionella marina]|uniref:FAS1-like dehydratase domain-containing protein n=1 Tax=Sciscionella marina TaxID=508770 RepID=UPI00036A9441|nr:MaoC family dehydratase N-terminal domain-containing protein [Sciscionella marina]
MALDPNFIGRHYPARETYEVGREKIAEFAAAIGDTNPIYLDPAAAAAAGHPDVIAPPTFLTIVNLRAINVIVGDPELGLDYGRMVHGDQSFDHRRPVHAGDRIAVSVTIEDIMARAGNDFITMRAEVHDEASELVCVCRAQLVVRGDEA